MPSDYSVIMTGRDQTWDGSVTISLILASVGLAFIIVVCSLVVLMLPDVWWPFSGLGFPFSIISVSTVPILVILLLYPLFIARSGFHYPVRLSALADQVLFSVMFLGPVTLIAEIILVFLVSYGWSLLKLPVVGQGPPTDQAAWSLVILLPVTSYTVIVGIPVVIVVYSLYWRFIKERGPMG
jgi:hypothetical protein